MSSPDEDEGSVWGAGVDPEGGLQAEGLGLALETPPGISEGEGGLPDPEAFEAEEEAGGWVLTGREGRPGSPADVEGHTLHHLGNEAASAILQQLTDRGDLHDRRYPSPESCDSEGSVVWVEPEPSASGISPWPRAPAGSPLVSAVPPYFRAPEGRRASGSTKRGAKGAKARAKVPAVPQWSCAPCTEGLGSPSDSESSDDFGEMQLLRVSIRRKGGGPLKPSSPQDTPRPTGTRGREEFPPVAGSFLSSVPRRPTSVVDRQAVGELDVSSRKAQSVVRPKVGSRVSYLPGAAAVGGLPRAPPRRKVVQEKKFPGGPPRVFPGSIFPSWGQRASAAPLEPATFPPISGVPLLRRDKKSSLVPSGTKQSKYTGAGQKSLARRKRGSEPVVGEEKDPKGQVSIRPRSSPLPTLPLPHPCTSLPMLRLSV